MVITALLLPHLFLGCAGSGAPYKREYGRVWKKMIQSEAWKLSMQDAGAMEVELQGYVASSTEMDDGLATMDTEGGRSFIFEEKFNILVNRAYYKIIAEVEAADIRLKKEYNNHMEKGRELQNGRDRTAQQELEGIRRKY